MQRPFIELIGNTLAIRFEDQVEAFLDGPTLRNASPSAERRGEADLFGNVAGGEHGKDYSKVKIINWQWVGGYAIRLYFSDGHSTGIYSFGFLHEIARANQGAS
ncbi:MAG: gamma-butyrobetaine hydroxylase-like domain-containing protein [Opitutales bacterium]